MIAHIEPFDIYGKSRLVEHYQFRQNMDKAELIYIANIQYSKIETRYNTNAEYLQIVKFNNIYWYRVFTPTKSAAAAGKHDLVRAPSTSRFLSVEYTHPRMYRSIPIELPKSIYMVGNQILSATFIMRYLKYNHALGDAYVFDDQYVINVMDDNINQFELKYGSYCVLGETGYTIMT